MHADSICCWQRVRASRHALSGLSPGSITYDSVAASKALSQPQSQLPSALVTQRAATFATCVPATGESTGAEHSMCARHSPASNRLSNDAQLGAAVGVCSSSESHNPTASTHGAWAVTP